MKKTIFLCGLSLLGFATLSAQSKGADKSIRFGLRMSPGLGWIKPKVAGALPNFAGKSDGSKLFFSGGIMIEKKITDNVYLATGADIVYAGGKMAYSDSLRANPYQDDIKYTPTAIRTTQISYTTQSVEIPLTLKLKSSEMNLMQFFGQIGLSVGMRFKGKVTRTDSYGGFTPAGLVAPSNYEVGSTANSDKTLSYLNPFRAALVIGGGMDYNISDSNTLVASLTYNNGFINQLAQRNENGAKVTGNTNYLQLNIGVLF